MTLNVSNSRFANHEFYQALRKQHPQINKQTTLRGMSPLGMEVRTVRSTPNAITHISTYQGLTSGRWLRRLLACLLRSTAMLEETLQLGMYLPNVYEDRYPVEQLAYKAPPTSDNPQGLCVLLYAYNPTDDILYFHTEEDEDVLP